MDEYGKLLIEKARNIILSNKNNPNRLKFIKEAMNDVYRYFKKIIKIPNYSDENLIEIFRLERLMCEEYLPLETEPYFDKNDSPLFPSVIITEKDCEQALKYIVHHTRLGLSDWNDLKNATLKGQCISASGHVERLCEKLNIQQIDFSCSEDLSLGIFHCFNIITFKLPNNQTRTYLVDCTYRQFFTYNESFLERIGLILKPGCCMGTYMLMDESRKKMAEELLKNGYIEFTPENIKNYFDGFVFSGRNGLYYEQLGKQQLTESDYVPHYSYEDYLIALQNGGLKEEKFIGDMREPLKNDIIFDIGDDIINTKTK